MKRLHTHSQHFLRSPTLVKELFGHSNLRAGETVIDIGAGSGVITSVLAQKVNQVIAVEVEPTTLAILRKNVEKYENVHVVQGDFLTMDLPQTPYSIFANIPFHLSSPIIERIITTDRPPRLAYLIVQKQFARKLVATDNRFFTGQLGMLLGARYDVRIRKPLKKTDFWPHPAVDTVFLEIKRLDTPRITPQEFAAYQKMTVSCFSDPHAYRRLPLVSQGISPEKKPSQLTIDQWVGLFHAHSEKPATKYRPVSPAKFGRKRTGR